MKRTACLLWWCLTLVAGTLGIVLTALKPLSPSRPAEATIGRSGTQSYNPQHRADGQTAAILGNVPNRKATLASSWAIPYGKEFWRRPTESSSTKGGSALPAHVDLGDIMERVSHAFAPDTNSACSVVRARTYTARFDGAGLRFSPLGLDGRNLEPDGKIAATFRTRAVGRGHATVVSQRSDAASPWVLGNTVQRALSSDAGVIEHYEARREGVEICWVLKQPPAGSGPLVVEAELAGLSYAGESKGGHHFADANGTARMRVGQVTLVEAKGRRTGLALTANANILTVTVPETVLAGATFPVAIDPLISPEFGMDEPVLSYAINDAMDPAIASNGSIYLAVWGDSRRLAGYHLFGTRISRDGTVLDPRGLPLNVIDGGTLYPAVASNGRDFLVTWRAGFTGGAIVGTRVTAEGVALDTPRLLQFGYSSAHPRPSVASDGTDYLVVWEHEANAAFEEDIFGARVSSDGMVLDSPPLVVHAGPNRHRGPAVAWNGTVYLAVWDDDGGNSHQQKTFGTRLSATGAGLDGDGFEIAPGASGTFPTPAVASDGHDFLVALGSGAVRVSGAGAVLGTTSFNADGIPSVTFDGHNYFIVSLSATIHGVRLSSSGTVLGTTVIKSAVNWDGWSRPGVASLGGDFFVTWQDRPVGQLQVFGAHVSSNGVAEDAIPLSTDLNSQFSPAIASNGEDYLVVWSDLRFDTYEDIFGVRVSGAGAVLDPAGLAIRRAPLREWSPAVASDGRDYFVAWQEYPGGNAWEVLGSRVFRDGTVMPPVRMNTERSDSRAPAVGSNGRDYLIAWSQWSGTRDLFMDIYAARVSGAGVLLDAPPFLINSHPSLESAPSIASDGENYLVAWEGLYFPTFVSAKRVTSGGVVLDPGGITLTTSTNEATAPSVAFNSRDYLVVWSELRQPFNNDIVGTRVATDGTVLDATPLIITAAADHQIFPRVASDGRDFLVLWHSERGPNYRADLLGRRVTAGGVFPEADGFLIQQAGYDIYGQPASNGTNYLVAYSASDSEGLYRVRGRFITPPPCVAPDDCDGDGVPDLRDRCPETPAGATVDANGCSAAQRDDDGDSVPNGRDLCPGTAAGAFVDANGCSADQRDTDGDGVTDSRDECPDTPAGSIVDAGGCPPEPTNCPPHIAWQATFGSGGYDDLRSLQQTADGGFILAGYSYGTDTNGNKTSPTIGGTGDYWLVRLNASGHKVWENSFGSHGDEQLFSVKQTEDGGYILGGWSDGFVTGTKTSPNLGGKDYWVVRTDAQGNQLWDRTFGGSESDTLMALETTTDGGFLLAGTSGSPPSGNKTSPDFGRDDYWIVRLDAQGNILWDRSFGGDGQDLLESVARTGDGGFILGGGSHSNEDTGNKSSNHFGDLDYWVVRVDADGNKLWDRSFGTTGPEILLALEQTRDGGFILGGFAVTGEDGTKTSPAHGSEDFWVVRLDADGFQLWDQTFGGAFTEYLLGVAQTADGGFVLAGFSMSPPGDTKTAPSYGIDDYWLVRIDSNGNQLWDQSFGGTGEDALFGFQITADGGFMLGGISSSPSGTGNKTSPHFEGAGSSGNDFDYWVLKLHPETPGDCDGDGVPDIRDACPDTATGAVVDARGCSIGQLCPCEGAWHNHGEYVRCVIDHAWDFYRQHRITAEQRRAIIHDAVMSDCGRQDAERVHLHLLPLTAEECRKEGFQIVLSGEAPDGCTLETSTDLIHWRSVSDEPVMITGWEVVCPSIDDGSSQFYRVRLNR